MAKKKTVTKTKGGKTKYTATPESTDGHSGGSYSGGSGGGSSAGSELVGGPGTRQGEILKSLNTNLDPARHFIIVASAPKYSDYVASTSVYCPMRTYSGTVGAYYDETGLNPYDGVEVRDTDGTTITGHTQSVQGFTEVLGVVPDAIFIDSFGTTTNEIRGAAVFNYIKSIEYEYRAYGHKVITVHYNDDAGPAFQQYMHYVRLVILFSDGSTESVVQPIVSKKVTDQIQLKDYKGPAEDSQILDNIHTPEGSVHPFNQLGRGVGSARAFGLDFEVLNESNALSSLGGGGSFDPYFTGTTASINGIFKSKEGFSALESNLPKGDKQYFMAGSSKTSNLIEDDQRYGGVFAMATQYLYSSFPALDAPEGGQSRSFRWTDRYSILPDVQISVSGSNFGAVFGAQGFYRHPRRQEIANSNIGGSLYDVTNGEWNGQNPPESARHARLMPGWNQSYSSGTYDSTPYNVFHPVHQFYNGGSRNTFRHEGVAFYQHLNGTNQASSDYEQAGRLYDAEMNAYLSSMAAYLRGNRSSVDSPNTPSYATYVDPAGATVRSLLQTKGNSNEDTKFYTDRPIGGNNATSSNFQYPNRSAAWGYVTDIVAAMLLPQGDKTTQGFRVDHSDLVSYVSNAHNFHTCIFGRQKNAEIANQTPTFEAVDLSQEVFIWDTIADAENDGVPGVRFPMIGAGSLGTFAGSFWDQFEGLWVPATGGFTGLSIDFITNGSLTICGLPFYVHIDFPVERTTRDGIGNSYTKAANSSSLHGSNLTSVENQDVVFGDPSLTQGGVDITTFQSILAPDGTVLNRLPIVHNSLPSGNFTGITGTVERYAVHDLNSNYFLDNRIFPGTGKIASAPYRATTRQPWGKLSQPSFNAIDRYAYFYGGLQYNMGGEANRTTVEIFLDNSQTSDDAPAPEIVFTRDRAVGTNNLFGRAVTTLVTGSTTAYPLGANGLEGNDIDTERMQFQTAIQANGFAPPSADWSTGNPSDIWNDLTRYTPGRYIEDPEAFLINDSERTFDTVIIYPQGTNSANGDGFDSSREFVKQRTQLEYTGSPSDLDRGYTDVDISDVGGSWNYYDSGQENLRNRVSNIRLQKGDLDHIGHFSDMFTFTAAEEAAFGSTGGAADAYQKYTESYFFVVPGDFNVDQGIEEEEEIILGCTDSTALNFDETATDNDGSCIFCANDENIAVSNNVFEMMSEAVTSASIGTLPGITIGGGQYGLDTISIQNGGYLGGSWVAGNIGNVMNYFPATDGIAYPDNALVAAPWSYFNAQFTITPANFANHPDLTGADQAEFTAWYSTEVDPDNWSFSVYNIEDWNEEGNWASDSSINGASNIQTNQNFLELSEILTNGDDAVPVAIFENLGSATSLKFGYQNESDVGTVNSNIEPGKHYFGILTFSSKDCAFDVHVMYNFWVAYCDCDLPAGENFAGGNFSYPWSSTNAFPGVYSGNDETFRICANNPLTGNRGFRRINRGDQLDGLCIIPDPYVDCNNIIDFCVTETRFDCTLVGDIGENPQSVGIGSIGVTVFGILTGSDIDEYNLLVDGQWLFFTLSLYLVIDGAAQDELIETIVIDDAFDYAGYGITAFNSGAITLSFENLSQGTYYIQLSQIGEPFPFQDPNEPLCVGLTPTDGTGNFSLGDGQDCIEFIQGCTDSTATNFNADATTNFNGQNIDQSELCEYEDCSDVFSVVRVTDITTTNSLAECGVDDTDPDNPVNFPADTGTGAATITLSNPDSVYFNVGIIQMVNGNVSVALTNLLGYYNTNAAAITDTTDTSTNHTLPAGDGTILGGFLPASNGTSVEIPADFFGGSGLYAGNFLVVAIPVAVTTADDPNFDPLIDCVQEIFSFINNFSTFQILLDTSQLVDCSEDCNDTIPGLCDDYVVGCTDQSAENFNELANFDDGSCEYGETTTEDCNNSPDSLECEECENLASGERGGLRICDEFFGTDEGCCDPTACNFNPLANPCMISRCEYECCDPTEDCGDVEETTDECEDEYGNVVPDCDPPECPDPTNPNCDPPVSNPCPEGSPCPPPPEPPCIQQGNCPEPPGDGDDTETVIIDEVIVNEISCDPMFNGVEFAQWQLAAMSCSADEGSKMYFKLRSGVKYEDRDLVKLTLINYLFNQGIDLPCLYSCDLETNSLKRGNRVKDCVDIWKKSIRETWASTSTYKKGDIVRLLKNVRGKTRASYYTAKTEVPAGNRPDVRINNNSYWTICKTVKAQEPIEGTENYLRVFYEYMIAQCSSCNIQPTSRSGGRNAFTSNITSTRSGGYVDSTNKAYPTQGGNRSYNSGSGLIDNDGNEIIF